MKEEAVEKELKNYKIENKRDHLLENIEEQLKRQAEEIAKRRQESRENDIILNEYFKNEREGMSGFRITL